MVKLTKDSFPNLPRRMKYITCGCIDCVKIRLDVGERHMKSQLLGFIRDIQLNMFEVNNG